MIRNSRFTVLKGSNENGNHYLIFKLLRKQGQGYVYYSLINSFVLLMVSIGRTDFSIEARLFSRNGGNDNFSPSVS